MFRRGIDEGVEISTTYALRGMAEATFSRYRLALKEMGTARGYALLLKVFDKDYVAIPRDSVRVEDPASIGRDAQTRE